MSVDLRWRARARRRLLHEALGSGDVRAAARAASRARLPRLGLDPNEAERASAARRRFGHALRAARSRRRSLTPRPVLIAMPTAQQRRPRPRVAPALVVVALAMCFVADAAPLAPAAARAVLTPGCARALAAPLGERRELPLAAPPEYYGPAYVAADGSGVAPIVDPYRSGPIARGFARLIGRVLDEATGQPVEDACLVYSYGLVRFRAPTDAAGIFVADIPAGTQTVDLEFEHLTHAPVLVQLQPWGEGQVRFFLDVRLPPH